MSKHSLMVKETGSVFLFKLIHAAIKVATIYIIAGNLSVDAYGIYIFLFTLALFGSSLGNLGIEYSNTFYLSKNKNEYSQIVTTNILFAIISGIIIGITILFIWLLLKKPFHDITFLNIIFVIINIPLLISKRLINGIIVGLQKFNLYNLNYILDWSIFLFILLILWYNELITVSYLLLSFCFSQLISNIAILLFLHRTKKIRLILSLSTLKYLIDYGYKVYFKNIFEMTSLRLDYFVIKYFLPSSFLGIYSIAVQSAEFLLYLPSAISLVLFPKIASSKNNTNKYFQRIFLKGIVSMIVIAIISFFIYPIIIKLIFGEKYIDSIILFKILLVGIIAFAGVRMNEAFLLGIAKQKYILIASVVAGILMIVLDIIFIPIYFVTAAAVISSCVYAIYFLLLFNFIVKIFKFQHEV